MMYASMLNLFTKQPKELIKTWSSFRSNKVVFDLLQTGARNGKSGAQQTFKTF